VARWFFVVFVTGLLVNCTDQDGPTQAYSGVENAYGVWRVTAIEYEAVDFYHDSLFEDYGFGYVTDTSMLLELTATRMTFTAYVADTCYAMMSQQYVLRADTIISDFFYVFDTYTEPDGYENYFGRISYDGSRLFVVGTEREGGEEDGGWYEDNQVTYTLERYHGAFPPHNAPTALCQNSGRFLRNFWPTAPYVVWQ
jgi:hypothetical protein